MYDVHLHVSAYYRLAAVKLSHMVWSLEYDVPLVAYL